MRREILLVYISVIEVCNEITSLPNEKGLVEPILDRSFTNNATQKLENGTFFSTPKYHSSGNEFYGAPFISKRSVFYYLAL